MRGICPRVLCVHAHLFGGSGHHPVHRHSKSLSAQDPSGHPDVQEREQWGRRGGVFPQGGRAHVRQLGLHRLFQDSGPECLSLRPTKRRRERHRHQFPELDGGRRGAAHHRALRAIRRQHPNGVAAVRHVQEPSGPRQTLCRQRLRAAQDGPAFLRRSHLLPHRQQGHFQQPDRFRFDRLREERNLHLRIRRGQPHPAHLQRIHLALSRLGGRRAIRGLHLLQGRQTGHLHPQPEHQAGDDHRSDGDQHHSRVGAR